VKVIIIGGCGFVGRNLVRYFQNCETIEAISVFDNESMGNRKHITQYDVNFIHGDIREYEPLEAAISGCDVIIHLAADTRVMDSIENPDMNFDVNVIGTYNVLKAARHHKVKSLIFASTGGAILGEVEPPVREDMFPQPTSPYGASKLFGEAYLSAFFHSYGISSCALRFSNVYGPGSFHKGSVVAHFFKKILAGEPLVVYGDGTQVRDYLFIDDLAQGVINAIQSKSSGVYQLGAGRPTSINQLIDTMRQVTDRNIDVIYKDFRAGEIYKTWCNVSKAEAEINFKAKTELQTGLSTTWKWFLEQK